MIPHLAPAWMLAGVVQAEKCPDCSSFLRRAENQDFCIPCWEWRTAHSLERAKRSAAELARKQAEAAEAITDEDNEYRWMEDQAAGEGDFTLALEYKWRAVILDMTGKRLPLKHAA